MTRTRTRKQAQQWFPRIPFFRRITTTTTFCYFLVECKWVDSHPAPTPKPPFKGWLCCGLWVAAEAWCWWVVMVRQSSLGMAFWCRCWWCTQMMIASGRWWVWTKREKERQCLLIGGWLRWTLEWFGVISVRRGFIVIFAGVFWSFQQRVWFYWN